MSEKKSLKQEAKGEGAPIWIISFADMMSLLMAFMVAMLAMSELKKDNKVKEVVHSFQEALGFEGGGLLPEGESPAAINLESEMMRIKKIMKSQRITHEGFSRDTGIEGQYPSVTTIREGLQIAIGGQVSFEPGKAVLLQKAREQLAVFADLIRGMNNKVRIRGHAVRKLPEQYRPYGSLYELSFVRALAVKDFMVQSGIQETRISVEACADNEPLNAQAYDEAARAQNRRVEIIVMETLVEDYQGVPSNTRGDLIDG